MTTMTLLYATLGVAQDASQEDIKDAFRRRAQATHPDKGGAPGEFERVREAYEVLSDPTRCRNYDETGQTTAVPSIEEEAEGVLAHIFTQYLDSGEGEDPLVSMRSVLGNSKQQQASVLKTADKTLTRISKLKGTLTRKTEGPNTLVAVLEAKLAGLTQAKAATERSLLVIAAMYKILSQWECKGFAPEKPQRSPYGHY